MSLRGLLEETVSDPVPPVDPVGLVARGRRRRRRVVAGRVVAGAVSLVLVPVLIADLAAPAVPSIDTAPVVGSGRDAAPHQETGESARAVVERESASSAAVTGQETDAQEDVRTPQAPDDSAAPDDPPLPQPTVGPDGPLVSASPAPSPSPPASGPDECRIDAETTVCRYTARSAGGYRVHADGQWTLTIIRGHEPVREIHSETAGTCGAIGIIQPGDHIWLEEGHRTGPTKVSTDTSPEVTVGAGHGC